MLIIKKLKLHNFLSHSDTVLELEPRTKSLISGCSGAGKSGIVESIIWAFFNRGRTGSDNRALIKKGEKSAKVSVILKDGEKEYEITRKITIDGKHDLEVLEIVNDLLFPIEANGKRNIQEYLEKKILRASYSLFINSAVSPQDNTESFVFQSAVKKKEILLEIIGADRFDSYYKKTKEEIEKIKPQALEKEIKIDNLKEFIEENKNAFAKLPKLKEENVILNSEITKLEKELSEITEKQTEASVINARISEKNSQLNDINNQTTIINDELKDFQKPEIPTATMLRRIKELKINEKKVNEWNFEVLKIEKNKPVLLVRPSDCGEINNKITLLLQEKTENCPELNKPCPIIIKERNKKIEELRNQLTRNNKEIAAFNQEFLKYEEAKKKLGECPKTNKEELASLEEKVEKFEREREQLNLNSNKKKELKVLKTKREKLRKEIEKIDVPNDPDVLYSDEIFCKQKLDETRYAYNENTKLLSVIENIVETVNTNKKIIKKFLKEKKELDAKIESLELLKDAFGNNGIKAIMIDSMISKLEDRINEVLSKLSGFKVILDTQKKGISENTVIEGLHIIIQNELGEELELTSFSGGEKMRIITAISLGFASFCNCNFRIMDEAVIGLDSDTVDSFIEILNNDILKKVDQVIVISHIPEIKDVFSEQIEVKKINGNSKIVIDN